VVVEDLVHVLFDDGLLEGVCVFGVVELGVVQLDVFLGVGGRLARAAHEHGVDLRGLHGRPEPVFAVRVDGGESLVAVGGGGRGTQDGLPAASRGCAGAGPGRSGVDRLPCEDGGELGVCGVCHCVLVVRDDGGVGRCGRQVVGVVRVAFVGESADGDRVVQPGLPKAHSLRFRFCRAFTGCASCAPRSPACASRLSCFE